MKDVVIAVISGSLLAWGFALWACYIVGQGIHIWLRASLAVSSGLNAVHSFKDYLQRKGPVIASRVFLETLAFMVFEYGSSAWFTLPSGGSPIIKVAIAGFFGYAADSILDQVFAKVGLDKELPPRQDDTPKP